MGKERISLTLDKNVLDRLDLEVDGFLGKSRSNAVEEIIRNYFESNRIAVILAGGPSKNQMIAGTKTFRPLVDIGGKTLIEDTVSKIVASGCENIIIAGSSELNSAIFTAIGDGGRQNCSVKYLEEDKHIGNVNTLSLASRFMKDTFLIVPCDHYFTFKLSTLRKAHRKNEGLATISVYAGTLESPVGSLVEIDCGRITQYTTGIDELPTHLNPTSIGYLEPEIRQYLKNKNTSLEKDVWPTLAADQQLYAEIVAGQFINCHNKKDVTTIRKIEKS